MVLLKATNLDKTLIVSVNSHTHLHVHPRDPLYINMPYYLFGRIVLILLLTLRCGKDSDCDQGAVCRAQLTKGKNLKPNLRC